MASLYFEQNTNSVRMSVKKKENPAKITNNEPNITKTNSDIFNGLGNKAPLLALIILFVTGFLIFKDYLLFEKIYCFKDIGSDSHNSSYPTIYNAADYIARHGMPKWSFNFGMGQSIFPFFLRDPFDIFLYIAGKDHIFGGFVFVEFTKAVLTGLTFFYFLKAVKLSDFTAITGSIFFAFCGFVIVGSGWYIFSFEAFNMALMLLSFELLLSKKKWYLFPLSIFLICISQPFNLYVYGLFLAAYAILRAFQTDRLSVKETGVLFLQMLGLGILGMLLSAPFMIENIVQLLESPRGGGTNSYAHVLLSTHILSLVDKVQFGTDVLRFFSSDILGSGNDYKGWQNILEAPLFYCGLPCLLLVPQIFPLLEKRQRIFFLVFLGIWLMPIVFPYFRYAFWLFTGNYYRGYSVIVAFFIVYYALQALELIFQKRKINLPVLAVTVVALFIFLYYPYFPDKDIVNSTISGFVSLMIIAYGILIFLISRQNSSPFLRYIFLLAVILEFTYLSRISVNDRDEVITSELAEKKGYNDYTVDAVNYLNHVDNSFYRIDKSYASSPAMHYSLNDGMAQGYHGTSEYSPFNQEYYIFYLQLMGISDKTDELQSRWARGLGDRPILESENRVKYILAKKNINPLWHFTCDSLATFGDVKVLRNKYLLPIGYTYSNYIKESVFGNLSTAQRDFVSLRACVLRDEDVSKYPALKEFQLRDTLAANAFTFDIYRSYVKDLSKDTLTVDKFDDSRIAGKITLNEDKMMYLSVPYDGGWKLTVDGQPRDKIILSAGMTGIMLSKGAHTLEMVYDLRYFSKGLMLSLLGIVLYAGLWLFTRKKKVTTEPTATI